MTFLATIHSSNHLLHQNNPWKSTTKRNWEIIWMQPNQMFEKKKQIFFITAQCNGKAAAIKL